MMRIPLFLGLFLLTASLRAESLLTWERSIELAYQNNPDLRSAQKTLESSRAFYRQSFNGVSPRLSLTSSYNRSNGDDRASRWQAGGSATMDLFDKGVFTDINQASTNLDRAEAILRDTSAVVLFDLRQSFANLLFSQEQERVSEQIRLIRERNTRLVTLRYNSGRESKGNMMRAKAELLQAEKGVLQASRTAKAARLGMAERLGESDYSTLTATGSLVVSAVSEPSIGQINEIVENHPALQIARINLTLAEVNLERSKSGLWPTLSANYARSFRDSEYFPGNGGWTASGVVSYPLFSGGLTSVYHGVRAGKASVSAAEEDLRATGNSLRTNIENAFAGFAAAAEEVDIQAAFLAAARQRNAEADIRYSNGLMTYEDWERIVSERVNFEQGLIRAQRDAVFAEATWGRAIGKVLIK